MDAVTGGLDVPALAKGLNLLVSILCVACAIAFMSEEGSYLSVIIGLETAFFAAALAARRFAEAFRLNTIPSANLPRVAV